MPQHYRIWTFVALSLCLSALWAALDAPAAVATDYYVSPIGNDANDGSEEAPWATLGKALKAPVAGGDTIYVGDGELSLGTGSVTVSRGGTDAERVTVEPAPGASPIIQCNGGIYLTAGGWTFRGLEFGADPTKNTTLIVAQAHHITIEDCEFRGAWAVMYTGAFSSDDITFRRNTIWLDRNHALAMSWRTPNSLIEHNTFHITANNDREAVVLFKANAYNIQMRYNTFVVHPGVTAMPPAIYLGGFYDPWPAGVHQSINITVHDNLFLNYGNSTVIFMSAVKDCTLYHNTIRCTRRAIWVRRPNSWCGVVPENVVIKNNIITTASTDRVLKVDPDCSTGFQSDHNVWYCPEGPPTVEWLDRIMSFANYIGTTGQDTHSLVADPLFASLGTGDLHLQPGSRAIDAGTTPPFNWPDLDGNARPAGGGYDMGCYEGGSGPADTTPPPQVSEPRVGDRPDDEGGAIEIDWRGYSPPDDFKEYRVYRAASDFSSISGMSPVATTAAVSHIDTTTIDGTDYYYAVTCVDWTGNEDPSVQAAGPVQSSNNNSPPAPGPVTGLLAHDTPNDDGGSIDLDWSGYSAPADSDHYNIYRSTSSFSNVSEMEPIATVDDASQTTYSDATVTDGTDYYYAVTCVDTDGKENTAVASAGPVQSVDHTAIPPDAVTALSVQDTPNDDGGAIDIDWSSYTPPADFGHYSVYRSTASFADVSDMTAIETVIDASAKAYTDTSTVEGTDYYYAVACVDAAGNENTSVTCAGPVRSEDNLAPLESHTFEPGVQLVTMPATPSNASLSMTEIFGTNQIARWDAAAQQYVYLTDAPSDPLFAVRPGAGLWVKFPSETPVSFRGNGLSTDTPFETSIEPQWNLVGNPWGASLPWGSIRSSREGSISDLGWTYDSDSGGYMEVHTISGLNRFLTSVPPYRAFWIKADASADKLIISAPGAQTASAASRGADALPIRWLVPIVVSAGEKRDVCNGIGAADTDVLIDNPPAAPDGVDAYLTPITNANARMAYELRSATGTQRFKLTVATELPNTDVTVAVPDLSQLPKDYRVTLRDLDTGNVRHMRTARAYTYNSGPAGGQRQFAIEVGSAISGALAVTGATVVPSRGTGAEIRYNISDAATVTTRIYNVAGRLVAELERGRSVARGAVASVWDGRSAMGTVTPNGAYVLEIAVAGQDGQRARAVCPFVVSR